MLTNDVEIFSFVWNTGWDRQIPCAICWDETGFPWATFLIASLDPFETYHTMTSVNSVRPWYLRATACSQALRSGWIPRSLPFQASYSAESLCLEWFYHDVVIKGCHRYHLATWCTIHCCLHASEPSANSNGPCISYIAPCSKRSQHSSDSKELSACEWTSTKTPTSC